MDDDKKLLFYSLHGVIMYELPEAKITGKPQIFVPALNYIYIPTHIYS